MERIAIFASGRGSNAREIMKYFHPMDEIQIALLCTDQAEAGALEHARAQDVASVVLSESQIKEGDEMLDVLKEFEISFIALAGYLKRIPPEVIETFPDRIVNLHPALLPDFGGKGMYGSNVHRAVLNSGAKESGITVHLVNEQYDEGEIIFQLSCPVREDDDPDVLANRIHALEHTHYPKVIHKWLTHLKTRSS